MIGMILGTFSVVLVRFTSDYGSNEYDLLQGKLFASLVTSIVSISFSLVWRYS